MTQTKKKTLIVLATTLILLFTLLVSIVGADQSGAVASADSTPATQSNATLDRLNSVMSNGRAEHVDKQTIAQRHEVAVSEVKEIGSDSVLKDFLRSGSGVGYLTTDIRNFSWDNRLTGLLSSPNMVALDGNGFTITLTASNPALFDGDMEQRSPTRFDHRTDNGEKAIFAGDTTDKWTMFSSTFIAGEASEHSNWTDVHGGLLGVLRDNQKICNCKFEYTGNIKDTSYKTENAVSMGLVVGICLGKIDNCSLTVNGSVDFLCGTTFEGSTLGSKKLETRTRHTIAFGGFAGMMTHGQAVVSNSKLILNGNLKITKVGKNNGSSDQYTTPHARCFVGGVVGWCANGAKVFNMVTEGNGDLEATFTNLDGNDRLRGLSGIIAAITGGDNAGGIDSLGGKIQSCGIINGVINKWTGNAKFYTRDADYSPNGTEGANTLPGLIVGVIGRKDTSDSATTVKDVYMSDGSTNRSYYTGTRFSIALDYTRHEANKGAEGARYGRRYSTNVLIQDVLGETDGSEDYKKADAANGYLAFSGTAENSALWAVYNINNNEGILWSKSIATGAVGDEKVSSLEYYYDKVKSISEAKQYDVTYTVITRGNDYNSNQNYVINYAHGKAVYFRRVVNGNPIEGNFQMNAIEYGRVLSVPALKLYSNKERTENKLVATLTDKSYWSCVSATNNQIRDITNNIVTPDTYEAFLYLKDVVGKDYSYIQFINDRYRYISYIYDDPDYLAYAETHEGYQPVREGVNGTLEKQIDWQPRVIQEVTPKGVSINWGKAKDVTLSDRGEEYDEMYNVTSYNEYYTPYDGDPVVFNLSVPDLHGSDTCTALYEYRMYDEYSDEYRLVDSCVNAGKYKVVVTGLDNSCYYLVGLDVVEYYCIDFEIKPLEIGLVVDNDLNPKTEGDTCTVQLTYEATEIRLSDRTEIFQKKADAEKALSAVDSKLGMALYNVLANDKYMVQYEYIAYGGDELNMRNVGKYQMIISMTGGTSSINYDMSKMATNIIVEIVPAEATLVSDHPDKKYSYPYGLLVKDEVNPKVRAIGEGEDDILTFGTPTYFKMINGVYDEINSEPFDAGMYQIKYELNTEVYYNYKSASITVDVEIEQRKVGFEFVGNEGNTYLKVEYGKKINGTNDDEYNNKLAVKFDRQGELNGIFSYEYSASYATYTFILTDAGNKATDIKLSEAVNVGRYIVEVGLDFYRRTSSNGWQTDENTKNNYVVVPPEKDIFYVEITKREVNVEINKVDTREYGDAVPQLIGNANTKVGRAWKYVANEDGDTFVFEEADNIVLTAVLGKLDQFAPVGSYAISIPDDKRTGDIYVYDKANMKWVKTEDSDTNLPTYNMIDNYTVNVVNNPDGDEDNNELYTIKPRIVKVKLFLNTGSVIYRDALPEYVEWRFVGDKQFFEQDGIDLELDWGDIVVGSKVGDYEVGLKIKANEDGSINGNYKLDVVKAEFSITPKTLTVKSAELMEEKEFDYDGDIHKPELEVHFVEEDDYDDADDLLKGDKIDFNYNYFELVDGVMATEATENPSFAGTYRVFIKDASNPNYTVVFSEDYERLEIIMTIRKRSVSISVLPAYRIYSITGSLTPIFDGEINEEDPDYPTQEEAEAENGEGFYKPYVYTDPNVDEKHKLVQNDARVHASMYIDEYYKELGVKRGVVKLVFDNLTPDPSAIDEDGNWKTIDFVSEDGSIIQIIDPKYRNYDITVIPGDLHVLDADLSQVEDYLNLRSSEEVYNGENRFEDFRVHTTNENIFNALKFRVYKYVAISSISKAEADASAAAYGKWTRKLIDSQYDNNNYEYTRNDAEGTFVRKYLDKVVDAGQYFKHITPADPDIFRGEYTMPFFITKAVREVSADDIKATVNYNAITLSSSIPGMEVSFNGAAFVKSNSFAGLSANTAYVVKVRFAEAANYKQSEEIVLNLRTGIDIRSIQSTLEKFNKIDFSNVSEYESKVLAYIDSVSQADYGLIDQAKFAMLQAQYEQLFRGASSVIEGAQQVGATAAGKSGKTSTSARAAALSVSGAGVLAMGFMFFAKRKKEDEEQSSAKAKSASAKRASKAIVIVVAIMLVCLTVFAGCDPTEDTAFSKADLYKIASYQDDAQTGKRDLTIEVKSGGVSLYKYDNGKETVYKGLDVSSFKPGADGIGFEFDDLYFTQDEFEIVDGIATFNADIKETLAFLGVRNAANGKVSVTVDVEKRKLNTINVSYDVVNSSITYNVSVAVKVN